jgi:hypothetical protein
LHVQIPVCVKNRAYESNGIKGYVQVDSARPFGIVTCPPG